MRIYTYWIWIVNCVGYMCLRDIYLHVPPFTMQEWGWCKLFGINYRTSRWQLNCSLHFFLITNANEISIYRFYPVVEQWSTPTAWVSPLAWRLSGPYRNLNRLGKLLDGAYITCLINVIILRIGRIQNLVPLVWSVLLVPIPVQVKL